MPVIWPEHIDWDDNNISHCTARISFEEINQALTNGALYRTNKKHRAGDLKAYGITDGGRRIVVVVKWDPATRTVRPITAWEDK